MRRMNRRTFIGTSVAASTLLTSPLSWANYGWSESAAEGDRRVSPIGLQLYTVRHMIETDFAGTIAKVAAVGYKEVEMAGYFDHSPKDVRAMLDSHGMKSPSSHIPYESLATGLPGAIDTAHIMGQTYLVCAWIEEAQRKKPDGWKRAADLFNRTGNECQKAGIQFCYHNHTFEFEPAATLDGKLPYDYFLENTDVRMVQMEMDLCWITVAGADPLVYFKRYPGRFPLVHVKDWKGQGGKMDDQATRMADVGQGNIDFKRIFAESKEAGIQHYFVENDAATSTEDVAISYKYLSNLRY
jgi:sugar phosphate isomerase/epimerase